MDTKIKVIKKCEFCGKEMAVEENSKKRFCDREECRHQRHEIAWKKYEAKKKQSKEVKVKKEVEVKKEVVYTKSETTDWQELMDIACELKSIRDKLISQIAKVNEVVRQCNGKEQDLLHKLEIMDEMTDEQATELAIKIKKNREDRRIFKNAQFLIGGLLKGLTIRNPEEFLKKGIEIISNPSYEPRVLDELFEKEKEENEKDFE